MATRPEAIVLRGVWHRYPGGRSWVLQGATAVIREAAITAVVGPNGGGKTTFMKIAAGLLRPSRGEVFLWGRSLWGMQGSERLEARRRIVYVHENPVMLRGSVADNIAAGLILRGVPRQEAVERTRLAAERLGLESVLEAKARHLSRGLQQLVSIARALALEPRILLLDEPFAHLDRGRRRLLLSLLDELRGEGRGVAVVSHSYYLLRRLADHVLVVENGAVEEAGLEELT